MTEPKLKLVNRGEETAAERSRRLEDEAHAAAGELVADWLTAVRTCVELAQAVAGAQAVGPGIRSVAERQARDLAAGLKTVEVVSGR